MCFLTTTKQKLIQQKNGTAKAVPGAFKIF